MKTLLSLLCCCFTISLFAQVSIEIEILQAEGAETREIYAYPPLAGRFFHSYREILNPESDNKYLLKADAKVPGFYYFFIGFSEDEAPDRIQLYLEPGDHYQVKIDARNINRKVTLSGPASAFNNFLNSRTREDIRFPFSRKSLPALLTDTVPKHILSRVNMAEEQDLQDLKNITDLNDQQLAYARADIRLYYKSLFSQITYMYGVKYNNGNSYFLPGWRSHLDALVVDEKANRYDVASRWYDRMADLKSSLAWHDNEDRLNELFGTEDTNEVYWQKNQYASAGLQEQESIMANQLARLIEGYPYEDFTPKAFKAFKEYFPNSVYLSYLNDAFTTTNQHQAGKQPKEAISQNTEKTLLEVLRGTTSEFSYIDLWATWCGPCKQQFKHKENLENYLSAYSDKIETVYISIDKPKDAGEAIRKVIDFYKLEGKHVWANAALREDLFSRFGKGESKTLRIPRYIIAKKDGTILNAEASRPEDWQTLRAELEAALCND